MVQKEFDLESLLEVRDLSRPEIEKRFELTSKDVTPGARYEAASGLERLANDESAPAAFYFRGPHLVVIYLDMDGMEDAPAHAIVERLGSPAAQLPSRAGKASTVNVYPQQGVAFSAAGDEVDFIEVFPPTTLDAYQEQLYEPPGDFIR